MAEPRKILDRSLTSRYFTLEGLERLTGVNPRDFDKLIVKELIDNSLDACDELGTTPKITVQIDTKDDLITFTVSDNANGIEEKSIAKIIDLTTISSSRYLYKYPTRGALGHFWKYILGMSHAFYSVNKRESSEAPITITTKGKRYELKVVNVNGSYNTISKITDTDLTPGTRVTITVPIHNTDWLRIYHLINLITSFAYVNPHAEFNFEYNSNTIISYSNDECCRGLPAIRESIHWFSLDEFKERTESEAQQNPSPPINSFINSFRGLSDSSNLTNEQSIETLARNSESIDELYEKMRSQSKPPSPSVLTPIGEKALLRRLAQVESIDPQTPHKYVVKQATSTNIVGGNRVSVPFIVETLTLLTHNNDRRLIIALNRSPKLDDPFGRYDFVLNGNKHVSGLAGILKENGIDAFEPATVLIHITCPNIQYKDLGKTEVDIDPFYQAVKDTVYKSTRFYRSARRRFTVSQNGNIPETTKKATFDILAEAVDFVSSNKKFSYRQRQLWYVIRDFFDKRGWKQYTPNYDYFGNKIIPEAKLNPEIDLSGLLKEANAELHEPRNKTVIHLSTEEEENYDIPKWKYNKILYIEKRGFKDVIIANHFHERYDLAVIGGQGESSEASRTLLKRIEESAHKRGIKIEILCIHDADLWGHDISLTLSHPTERMKDHSVTIKDLGLTLTEATSLGLKPETVIHDKPRKISKKLLHYLPDKELLLLTGKTSLDELDKPLKMSNRVELNAFTPEQFMEWLAKKLRDNSIEAKVRPPDDVIAAETAKIKDESLNTCIKETILDLCGGQDTINQLKATIAEQSGLTDLDVSKQVDESLQEHPVEGWDDLIKMEVKNKISQIYLSNWPREAILDAIKKRILGGSNN